MLGVNKLNRQQGPGAAQAGGARGGGRFDPGPGRGGRGGRGDPGGPGMLKRLYIFFFYNLRLQTLK